MFNILKRLEEHNVTMHVEACEKFFKYEENVENKSGTVFLFSRGDKVRLAILDNKKKSNKGIADWLSNEMDEFIKFLDEKDAGKEE